MNKEKSFEECMKELEKIIIHLEKGELSLDESMKLYEKGVVISKECDDMLKNAKLKLEELVEQKDEVI